MPPRWWHACARAHASITFCSLQTLASFMRIFGVAVPLFLTISSAPHLSGIIGQGSLDRSHGMSPAVAAAQRTSRDGCARCPGFSFVALCVCVCGRAPVHRRAHTRRGTRRRSRVTTLTSTSTPTASHHMKAFEPSIALCRARACDALRLNMMCGSVGGVCVFSRDKLEAE